MKRYKLIKELLPVGTLVEDPAPYKTEYCMPHYEVLIGIGKDHTASFIVDAEAVENNPDYFEELPEEVQS